MTFTLAVPEQHACNSVSPRSDPGFVVTLTVVLPAGLVNQRFRGGSLEAEAESVSEPLVDLGKDLLKRWQVSGFPVVIGAVVIVVAGTLSTALDRIIFCRLQDFTSH